MGAFTAIEDVSCKSTIVNVYNGTGGSNSIPKNSAYALIAYKLVTTDASGDLIYADAGTLSHVSKVLGVGKSAATMAGELVEVQTTGVLTNTGWSFTVGAPLYLGLGGDIVETQVGVINVPVGYAVSATEIFIEIQRGITRS